MVFVRKENEEEELLFDELNSRKKFRAKIAKEIFCLFLYKNSSFFSKQTQSSGELYVTFN
jgi:hypothetical protein